MSNFTKNERIKGIAGINIVSTLAQIVQIGTITPLLSLSLEKLNFTALEIGIIVAASWIAILCLYKFIPSMLEKFGMVYSILLSSILSIIAIISMTTSSHFVSFFICNFLLGSGLIIRWIVCDTWLIMIAGDKERGRAIGIHETLMGAGIAVGPMLIALFGYGQIMFYISAFLILISGVASLSLIKFNTYPKVPNKSEGVGLFSIIYIALIGAFFAGFIETSSISFLSIFYLSIGFVTGVATAMLASFGLGNAILQMPLGALVDKKSSLFSFALVGIILLVCTLSLFIEMPIWASAAVVFVFGGCVGGLNTLAVLDAGAKVEQGQISTAMTFIAISYTLGSIIGPIATGWTVSYVTKYGLPLMILVFISLFLFFLLLQNKTAKRDLNV